VTKRVLLADVNVALLEALRRTLAPIASVVCCTDFGAARRELLANPYDLLVTNLRLEAYNGLHLVYMAQSSGLLPRSIVYTDHFEGALAREVHRSGAFYEVSSRLASSLPHYVAASLPASDRRMLSAGDRRRLFRGGRRSADLAALSV
jgi:hypothetical protein